MSGRYRPPEFEGLGPAVTSGPSHIPRKKLHDDSINLRVGFRYLRVQIERERGSVVNGLLAYALGPGRLDDPRDRGEPVPLDYPARVLAPPRLSSILSHSADLWSVCVNAVHEPPGGIDPPLSDQDVGDSCACAGAAGAGEMNLTPPRPFGGYPVAQGGQVHILLPLQVGQPPLTSRGRSGVIPFGCGHICRRIL